MINKSTEVSNSDTLTKLNETLSKHGKKNERINIIDIAPEATAYHEYRKGNGERDAKKLDIPEQGFNCSILGDTIGMDIFYDKSPQKDRLKECPECDASISTKKGLFRKKHIFECWIMGKFKVSNNVEDLEKKLKSK